MHMIIMGENLLKTTFYIDMVLGIWQGDYGKLKHARVKRHDIDVLDRPIGLH